MAVHPAKRVALIDPVGVKAGMDHYDLLLANGFSAEGVQVILYSNFKREESGTPVHQYFFNTNVAKLSAIASNFFGTLKAFRNAQQQGISWIIVHIFRAGFFDLVTLTLARLMGLKICAIIHDIEGLDTYTLPLIRNRVLHQLPTIRVVHNDYCKSELERQPGNRNTPTAVIPHVHFKHLFTGYQKTPELLQQLRNNQSIS